MDTPEIGPQWGHDGPERPDPVQPHVDTPERPPHAHSDPTILHIGRAWAGHAIEDWCRCHKAACGLVDEIDPTCPEHSWTAAKSMRQAHLNTHCPGAE